MRDKLSMGSDSSLQERVEQCVQLLMRSKGRLRERLHSVDLWLTPLKSRDFTVEAEPHFAALIAILDKYRVILPMGYTFYRDPSPKDRDVLAEEMRELYRACVLAEAEYWKE